jgi:translation initiation factor 2 subunit 3
LKILAANEHCPQPQTSEHLAAVDIMQLNSIIILQSKVDLVGKVEADDHRERINDFIKG